MTLTTFFPYSDLFLEAETVWLRGQCQPTPGPLESPFGFPGLHKRMMVPNSEESNGSRQSLPANAKARSSSKLETSAEKDSEEYRKLRERNNEAVKKSRTRTKMRTQATLEKVEKLRQENSNLEGKIDGLKKELDLLKELFMSHAGTKSMKRLTEVDLEVLLAEAAPANKRRKGAPYTGRSRELIESEVQALLGQEEERDNGLEDDEACPSTSQADQTDNSNSSALGESSQSGEVLEALQEQQEQLAMEMVEAQQQVAIGESFAIIDDSSENASIWATETGESVVVTISDDGQALVTSAGVTVQQDLHATFIEGELLMLE